jgi:hypothetical protein
MSRNNTHLLYKPFDTFDWDHRDQFRSRHRSLTSSSGLRGVMIYLHQDYSDTHSHPCNSGTSFWWKWNEQSLWGWSEKRFRSFRYKSFCSNSTRDTCDHSSQKGNDIHVHDPCGDVLPPPKLKSGTWKVKGWEVEPWFEWFSSSRESIESKVSLKLKRLNF